MATTLKEIARRAGVSVSTASRVLSGADYPVNNAMRRRVEAAANELDYVPNAQAQGLLHGNPRSVGLLVGDVGDPYFSALIDGVYDAATELQYMVTVVNTHRSLRREVEAFRSLRAHRVGISIIAGSGIVDSRYAETMAATVRTARAADEAIVVIGRHDLDLNLPGVIVDNVRAGRLIGEHLRELGHRRVGVVAGMMELTSTIDRITGLREALGDDLKIVREVEPTRDGGWAGTGDLFAAEPGLTAVVGTADQMALGAMVWLREHGMSVPRDVSVAGCNDIWVSRDLVPSLTSVHLPLREMGRAALELGIEARDGVTSRREFPVTLIKRDSTGAAPMATG